MLIALAAKVDASPTDDARAEAIRYANILTGDDPDAFTATDGVSDDDCDDDDCDGDGDGDDDRDDDDRDDRDDDRNEYDRADNAEDSGVMASALAGDDDRAPERGADDAEDRGVMTSEVVGDDDDGPDRSLDSESVSSDLAGGALAGHIAGELAMLESGLDAGDVSGDDVSFAATSAGAAETYESWMRHQRPSPWGRVDLGVAWRQRWSEPMSGMSRRYDEVWLVATWRR